MGEGSGVAGAIGGDWCSLADWADVYALREGALSWAHTEGTDTMVRNQMHRAMLTVVVGLAMAVAAQAQPGRGPGGPGGPFGGGGGPPVTTAQLERYAKVLGLTADQREAAKALVEGAEKQSREAGEKMREEFRKAREAEENGGGGGGPPEGMRERMDKMRTERENLEKATLSDIKSILTPEQEKLWPSVERMRRREAVGRQGMISGERVDLLEIAERQEWAAEVKAKAKPVLEAYEMDLDRALVQREEVYRDGMGAVREKMRDGDEAGAQAIMDRGRQASQRVRDVNKKYARELEEILPDAGKQALRGAVLRASFPRIYNPRLAERQLEAAGKLKGLDTAQAEQIKALSEKSGRDYKALRDKLVAATEDAENNLKVGDMRQRFRGGGGDEEGVMGDLNRERRQLDRGVEAKLKEILKPEQMKELPSEQDEEDGPGGGRGGDRRRQRNERT